MKVQIDSFRCNVQFLVDKRLGNLMVYLNQKFGKNQPKPITKLSAKISYFKKTSSNRKKFMFL